MKNFKVMIIDKSGTIKGEESLKLPTGVSPVLIAQAARVFLSNQRSARARAKTRAAVSGTGAKIWRQKGTGRARHGDRQAPIFVGGGVAHGPTGTENFKQKLNQKMSQKATAALLSEKIKEKKFLVIKGVEFAKTKEAASFLEKVRNEMKIEKRIGFLLPKDEGLKRYLKNLSQVEILNVCSLNPFFLLRIDFLLATENALKELEKRFSLVSEKNENNH